MPPRKGRKPMYWVDTLFVICIGKALFPINKQWRFAQWFMWLDFFLNPFMLAAYLHYGAGTPSYWLTWLVIFLVFYVVALITALVTRDNSPAKGHSHHSH